VQQGVQTLINTVQNAVYALTGSGSLLQQINGVFQSLGQLTNVSVSNVSVNGNGFGATVTYTGSNFQASLNYNSAGGGSGSGTVTIGGTTFNVSYSGSAGISGTVIMTTGGTLVSLNYNGPQNNSYSVTFQGANNLSFGYSSTSGATVNYSTSDGSFSLGGSVSNNGWSCHIGFSF
jgi:hypothetical protein